IEAQIAKLRRGMGRLIDGYAEGLIDKADFAPRIVGLRQRIETWEEQATALRDEAAQRAALSLIVGRLEDFARQVGNRMAAVDWSLQRDLIRTLVKRVEIDRGDINVVFRVAPSFDPSHGGSQGHSSLHHCGRGGYAALRTRGHSYGRALRGVGDRLLGVACVLLQRQGVVELRPGEGGARGGA